MKIFITLMLLSVLALAGCLGGNDYTDEGYSPPYEEPLLPVNVYLDAADRERVANLDLVHELDYLTLFAGDQAGDFDWIPQDSGLLIWANQPLYNLQIVVLDIEEYESDSWTLFISDILYEIDVLPYGTHLWLNRFMVTGGVMPREGISFEDASGQRHDLAIADSRVDSDPPFFFVAF